MVQTKVVWLADMEGMISDQMVKKDSPEGENMHKLHYKQQRS